MKGRVRRTLGAFPHLGEVVLLIVLCSWYLLNLRGAMNVGEVLYAQYGYSAVTGDPYVNPTHMIAPTAKYFIGVGQLVFGEGTFGARLPVVLFGLATVHVTYRLGVLLADRLVGLLAGALLGATYFFATRSVLAILDVPLTFFFVGGIYALLCFGRTGETRWVVWTGLAIGGVLTSKAYGFIYALPIVLGVLWFLWQDFGGQQRFRQAKYFVGSAVAFVAVVYLPYYVVAHPPVERDFGELIKQFLGLPESVGAFVQLVFNIPIVGNVAYVVGATLGHNLKHVGGGHAIEVGSTVYREPPIWTYVYWLTTEVGLFYLLSLIVTLGGGVLGLRNDGQRDRAFLAWVVVLPLLFVSLLTVKFPRYILPLVPVLAVTGIYYAADMSSRLRDLNSWSISRPDIDRVVMLSVVALLLIVPPSPVANSAVSPINTDTGYDEVARFIEEYQAQHEDETIVVISYHGTTLDYYLQDDIEIVAFTPKDPQGNAARYSSYRERIESGEVAFVVDLRQNRRLQGTPFYRYVRSNGDVRMMFTQSPDRKRLVVFGFE
ncbi:glycosyltransferase family 39 protein [Salinirubellus salinus]|uniref:Glycosyltransferase family 39 protein n=1 Tax=Salinirubellus salinus TaxID=1364945 RepID=A0A9E7R341_9EURY|nr:glycosyltransferase family 39 protein [Salinirubellus salinus]UWM54384.1 glycosyltransferase family 39 protein [Salinirubellus salinus]